MPTITANLVDLHQRRTYPAEITFDGERITAIRAIDQLPDDAGYLLPGFVDAHVHIESSMLPPSEFARMAVVHGTVATVSDPHEIANVLGNEGVAYMLDDAKRVPLKYCFGAPSCVPATGFETAGATLDAEDVAQLLQNPAIGYLSEMMNFPGVLHGDTEVLAKIASAQALGKPVDGHAPGLRGEEARRYFAAGITTDHECFTLEEGVDKARLGVKILIREGSAARNFEALWPLLNEFPTQIMFCSDDKHPDDLVRGHINYASCRALSPRDATCLTPCAPPAFTRRNITNSPSDFSAWAITLILYRSATCAISSSPPPGSMARKWQKTGEPCCHDSAPPPQINSWPIRSKRVTFNCFTKKMAQISASYGYMTVKS
jgi:adenine deaminase